MLCLIGKSFCGLDLTFFLTYLAITLAIGFWVGRREKATVSDYFRAGNRLPWYAVGCSIIAAGISSEQFVGETGYAYQYGMPVVNWEWLIFPAMSLFLWIFVPLYVRNNVSTMPEYLERRFGGRSRTLYASLIIASYVLANFALVFYTAGFAMEQMWGVNRFVAIAVIAIATGAYTIYGGLESVAWTDFFQCALLVGGGAYVFFAGMAHPQVGWDFSKVLGDSTRAHIMGGGKEFPWTAWVVLALSTNTWYYATDQFINQRCLGARNEWHAKMGVMLAVGIQVIMPLATCFPGMIYYVINPHLTQADQAYPSMVAEVVPAGLRGLVVAAVLGAVMSTVSGLVNSTSTMFTLDILRRTKGRDWSELKLVRWGQISGALALVLGAGFSVAVMNWQKHVPLLSGYLGAHGRSRGGSLPGRCLVEGRERARRRGRPVASHYYCPHHLPQADPRRSRNPFPPCQPRELHGLCWAGICGGHCLADLPVAGHPPEETDSLLSDFQRGADPYRHQKHRSHRNHGCGFGHRGDPGVLFQGQSAASQHVGSLDAARAWRVGEVVSEPLGLVARARRPHGGALH